MPAIANTYIVDAAAKITERLDGLSVQAIENTTAPTRSTWLVQLSDESGPVKALCIGSAAEAARFLEGMQEALDIVNRW